jgi:ureidoglycolate lyase
MQGAAQNKLIAEPISRQAYAPYGNVIAASAELPNRPANFGRAQRFDFLAQVHNLRSTDTPLNLCIFRCSPYTQPVLNVDVLEKHPHSTQVFLPMHDGRFITIVATGAETPDLNTLRAFIVEAPAGISYKPGTWHYPMTALDKQLDLACVIFEDGGKEDCIIAQLPETLAVQI